MKKKTAGCTCRGVLLVRMLEELLQQPGPELVEHLLQVDVGASVVVPQIRVKVGEDLPVLGVEEAVRLGESLL